jgi:SAM-dependent methyltransferase
VTLTHERVGARARVAVADLNLTLPFPDHAFDLVVAPLVIHYLSDRTATFREFFRVLRPGGRAVISTQHPTTDWLRKGGSYFEIREETDTWEWEGVAVDVHFWREPLTTLCAAATDAGFLIERLVEPLPAESMRTRWPETWEKLHQRPGFLMLRLLRPAS